MKRSLFAIALAAALPLSAQAADPISHLFGEVGYNHTSALGEAMNGYDFKGEAHISDHFYALGSYSHVQKDNVDFGFPILIDIQFTQYALGVGYHHALSERAEWNAEASYVRDDIDESANAFGADSFGANGYRVATGLRGMLSNKFEGNIYINYTNVNDFGNGIGGGLGGQFHITDTWGITAGYDHSKRDSSNVNTWTVGVRASY
jgi:opacity protein-like surface antigen